MIAPHSANSVALTRRHLIGAGAFLAISSLVPGRAAAHSPDWSDMVARSLPAIASIQARGTDRPDDWQDDQSHGSAFVIGSDGMMMTNAHVAAMHKAMNVRFPNGQMLIADIVDRQQLPDLALLKLRQPPKNLHVLEFADFDSARPGQPVIAIGSPLNYDFSVTSGIISALDRVYEAAFGAFMMQHDAALNPGNSGGPLLNSEGKVLGVNCATPEETVYDIGIGMAVPAHIARHYRQRFIDQGGYSYSSIGARLRKIDTTLARLLGRERAGGLLVERILPESAAAAALLRSGDILLELDGKAIVRPADLARKLWFTPPATKLSLGVARQEETLSLELISQAADSSSLLHAQQLITREGLDDQGAPDFGLELADKYAENGASYIVIERVEPGSHAQMSGLAPGDIILQINQENLRDASEAREMLTRSNENIVLLLIARHGQQQQFISLSRQPGKGGQPGSYGEVF